jgi:hypothetical protein
MLAQILKHVLRCIPFTLHEYLNAKVRFNVALVNFYKAHYRRCEVSSSGSWHLSAITSQDNPSVRNTDELISAESSPRELRCHGCKKRNATRRRNEASQRDQFTVTASTIFSFHDNRKRGERLGENKQKPSTNRNLRIRRSCISF